MNTRHLSLALALAFGAAVASPALAGPPPFQRTVLVTGQLTPVQNGTALLSALNGLGATGPANRWLIRLEPGVFDLGTQTLNLKSFVDIEGSGRGVTTIASRVSFNPVVNCAPNVRSEVRELTIQATPPSGQAYGVILNSTQASLSRVNVVVNGTNTVLGVLVSGAVSPVLTDVAITAGSTTSTVYGLNFQGSQPVVHDVSVTLGSANSMNVGLYQIQGGMATVDGLDVAISGTKINIGIWIAKNGSLKLTRGKVAVAGSQAFGLENEGGGTVTVTDSSIVGTATGFGGFGIRQSVNPGTVVVERSTLQGSSNSIASFNASTFRVAMTRLVSPISNNGPQATYTCVGAYNQNFALLNSGCL